MSNQQIPVLDHATMHSLIDRVIVKITHQVAKIDLTGSNFAPSEQDPTKLYSVQTVLDGLYHEKWEFCADREFFHRVTENMMESKSDDPTDLEEYSKEFFNVLCGHLVAEIFRYTKIPTRFQVPSFVPACACSNPTERENLSMCYSSDHAETVIFRAVS